MLSVVELKVAVCYKTVQLVHIKSKLINFYVFEIPRIVETEDKSNRFFLIVVYHKSKPEADI